MSSNEAGKSEGDEARQLAAFYLDETLCGVDIDLVQEINEDFSITPLPLAPDYVVGIMNLRGQIVTVINQCKKLGFNVSPMGRNSRVIIVRSQDEHIGLLVDKVTEVVTIRKNDVAEPPSNIKGAQGRFFQGVVQTADHELMALIDVEAVLADE